MNALQELLTKIQQFQKDVRREVDEETMDVCRLEVLLDEFAAPPDIDIPELNLLKKVAVLMCNVTSKYVD